MRNGFLSAAQAGTLVLRGAFDERLSAFYGVSGDALQAYRLRIADAADRFVSLYGERPVRIFSVSGRTELGGNHTDHQHGHVLAGGISPDIIAVASPDPVPLMRVQSQGYAEDVAALSDLEIKPEETGTSAALLRGTAARFQQLGREPGGFVAYAVSDVPQGSGMSSSAAYEVMLGLICNDFFAENAFSAAELAMIAQYAENVYFGKPCGLMDQMACALGGIAAMDFHDPAAPVCEQLRLDLAAEGYALCIIDSGAGHADLTEEYAAISREMKAAAAELGGKVLRDTDEALFWRAIPQLRKACGDRAVMRAAHFYAEDRRAAEQAEALRTGNFERYLELVRESGHSSEFALQNIYASGKPQKQAVAVTIALCRHLLGQRGAVRVHGGGFAGTVQAYVPLDLVGAFRSGTDAVLGDGACRVMQIRSCGASALWEKEEVSACC